MIIKIICDKVEDMCLYQKEPIWRAGGMALWLTSGCSSKWPAKVQFPAAT